MSDEKFVLGEAVNLVDYGRGVRPGVVVGVHVVTEIEVRWTHDDGTPYEETMRYRPRDLRHGE